MVFNNQRYNNTYGRERDLTDMIYFVSAVPEA